MSKIGKNIKKIRNVRGLSQQAFGELFDLTRGNISSYEEMRAEPKIDSALIIAKYFSISLEDFICRELSVNELLNYDTGIVLETEKLKRSNQIRTVPYVSGLDLSDFVENFNDSDYFDGLPQIAVPSSSKLDLLALEVDNMEAFPLEHNYKIGDILIYEKVVRENMHRVENKLGMKIDREGMNIGVFERVDNDISLVLNEWVKYPFDIESDSIYWVLRGLYTKVV